MFDSCVVHIGTEKTGTTSIQHFLHHNKDRLRAQGFFFPESFGFPSQTALTVCVGKKSALGSLTIGIGDESAALDNFREATMARFRQELAKAQGCHTLLLSSEHLHSRLRDPQDIEGLKALIGSFAQNIKVLVYLRRQDRVAVSLASTYYKAGHANSWKLPNCSQKLPYYYDYESLLDNYSRVFGLENCVARLFEPDFFEDHDLIADYCKQVGINLSASFVRHREENQSLSLFGQKLLIELNRYVPRTSGDGRNPARRSLVNCVSELYPGKPPLLTKAQALGFYRHFVESNFSVKQKFFPHLKRDDLFDDDFSSYPDEITGEDFSFEKACEAAARLWIWQAERIETLQQRLSQQAEALKILKQH